MFLINDNLRKMKKKDPPILGLSYRGLPNGAENNQNAANQISNGSTSPQKRASNGSTSSGAGESGAPFSPPAPSPPKQPAIAANGDSTSQLSSDRESQSSIAYSGQLPKISNPLYGVNAASQYLPTSPSNSTLNSTTAPSVNNQMYNGYNGTSNNNNNTQAQKTSETNQSNAKPAQFIPSSQPPFNRVSSDELGSPTGILNGVRKAPEGQDNESFVHEEDLDSPKDLIVSANQIDLPTEASSATHYTTDNNGKINVHVTVMINAGTLADLKKQRAQIRNASPSESSLSPVDGSPRIVPASPPPPGDVPRFSGNTSEVVGDARSNRCCVLM